jgi:hypothetical protein
MLREHERMRISVPEHGVYEQCSSTIVADRQEGLIVVSAGANPDPK